MSKPLRSGSTPQFFYSPRNVNDLWQGRAVLLVLAPSLSWMTLLWSDGSTRSLALSSLQNSRLRLYPSSIVRSHPLPRASARYWHGSAEAAGGEGTWTALAVLGLPAPLQAGAVRRGESRTSRACTQHFDTSCLARARIGCPPLSHQGFLYQVPYLQLTVDWPSWAWVCCMHISPSHSAGLLFPPWLVEKNTPRNLSGFAWMCGFSAQCAVECSCSVCYMACSNPCWAVLGRERTLWRNAWALLFR